MKKISYIIITLISVAFATCSNIAEDDRLIYVEPTTVNRNVLIEDFTGQKCVNCPNATDAIHEIQAAYGDDHVVAVAIHCGPFGYAAPKGLMTEFTQEYWQAWFTNEGQPIAKVNRGEATNDYANWSALVSAELAIKTDVDIKLATSYDSATMTAKITPTISALEGTKGKLQLWLIEDGIVAIQTLPNGSTQKDYVHNHVLRDALNGTWGEEVSFTNADFTKDYTYDFTDKGYVPENCSIVAFVYDDKGVKKVVKQTIIK